jgi:hypothetical protein
MTCFGRHQRLYLTPSAPLPVYIASTFNQSRLPTMRVARHESSMSDNSMSRHKSIVQIAQQCARAVVPTARSHCCGMSCPARQRYRVANTSALNARCANGTMRAAGAGTCEARQLHKLVAQRRRCGGTAAPSPPLSPPLRSPHPSSAASRRTACLSQPNESSTAETGIQKGSSMEEEEAEGDTRNKGGRLSIHCGHGGSSGGTGLSKRNLLASMVSAPASGKSKRKRRKQLCVDPA